MRPVKREEILDYITYTEKRSELQSSVLKQKTAYEMQRGLVGSEMCIRDSLEDVQKIAKQFGAFFIKDEVNRSAVGYLVTHTGYTYLLDRKGRVRKMFSSKVDVPEMIETVNLLLKP